MVPLSHAHVRKKSEMKSKHVAALADHFSAVQQNIIHRSPCIVAVAHISGVQCMLCARHIRRSVTNHTHGAPFSTPVHYSPSCVRHYPPPPLFSHFFYFFSLTCPQVSRETQQETREVPGAY